MTNEEVIEIMKDLKTKSIYYLLDGHKIISLTLDNDKVIAFADVVIEALEEQIPKKMVGKQCPCCSWEMPESALFLKTRCWNCGQLIDWSKDND